MCVCDTHLLEELGVDVYGGVADGGRQGFDWPGRIDAVHPGVEGVELLQRKHVLPGGAQLEEALPGVLIHLQTQHTVGQRQHTH